ncbi:hypothetical protein HanPSC8_Chr08g0337481 [Helianthus annuus]|nr:hypothetical protein HanPSC8_Chr08g0337481 [Helianthus annuus]
MYTLGLRQWWPGETLVIPLPEFEESYDNREGLLNSNTWTEVRVGTEGYVKTSMFSIV